MGTKKKRVLLKNLKSKKQLILFSVALLVIALITFCWWLFFGRFEVSTRDAYVNGNLVSLTPQIPGYVTAVYCDETELVKEGQVLVTLDDTDNKLFLDKASANLGTAIRNVTEMFENVYALAAIVREKEAALIRAEIDFKDREAVVSSGAVSVEEYIFSKTSLEAAEGALSASVFNLRKAISLVEGTTVRNHPMVLAAIEAVKLAFVNLNRCVIKAPATGIVAQRGVQVGESVTPASQLLAIVPLDQVWVDANFKEIHMSKIRIGQKASVTSDFYGSGVNYEGTVIGIAGGTGAVFSPLPPQNATGNWIKIVQRVPVRIALSGVMLTKYPLRLGLSMDISVDVKDTSGLKVPGVIRDAIPLWKTTIFSDQEKGVDTLIEKIFSQNQSFVGMISEEVKLLGNHRR